MSSFSDFDLDFEYGVSGEKLVSDLLLGKRTIEVKRDRRWVDTGNIYVETECFFTKTNTWGNSGLTITKAGYWAFVLEDSVVIVPTEVLRFAVAVYGKEIQCQIPPNLSKGYLLTPENLISATKEYPRE